MQVYLFICIKYRKWEKEYMRGSEVDVNSFEWKQVEMPEKWYWGNDRKYGIEKRIVKRWKDEESKY